MNIEFNRSVHQALSKAYMPESSMINKEIETKPQDISFGEIINNELEKLNDKHIYADNMVNEFIAGEGQDLHSIMVATEEARLSMELAVQIRNKVIDALNTVNNIQL